MQMHIFDFFYAAKIFTNSTSKTDKVFVDLVAFFNEMQKCDSSSVWFNRYYGFAI